MAPTTTANAMTALKLALLAFQTAGPVLLEILEAIQAAKAAAPDGKPAPDAIRAAVATALIEKTTTA